MKVVHVMADGTRRESMEGVVVPKEMTATYQVVYEWAARQSCKNEKGNDENEKQGCLCGFDVV